MRLGLEQVLGRAHGDGALGTDRGGGGRRQGDLEGEGQAEGHAWLPRDQPGGW